MSIKERINGLKAELEIAQGRVLLISAELEEAESDIQNHVYESLDRAEHVLFSMFENQAHEDCEGAGNVGSDVYTQDFIVDGVEYTASGFFEYNRHDKTYYYIDGSDYSYKEKACTN